MAKCEHHETSSLCEGTSTGADIALTLLYHQFLRYRKFIYPDLRMRNCNVDKIMRYDCSRKDFLFL